MGFLGIFLLLSSCNPGNVTQTANLRAQIENLLQLHSYEYRYREILYLGDQRTLLGFIPTRDRQFLFRVDFLVSAGVDLTRGYTLSSGPGNKMTLVLPSPEILSVDAQEETLYQYVNQTFGGDLRILEIGDLLELASQSISQDSIERGILHQAKQEAESLVRSFFLSLGIDEVVLEWAPHG